MKFYKHNNHEYFSIQAEKFETVKSSDNKMTIKGLAIVYNKLSDDRGGWYVRIAPNSIKWNSDVFCLYNHNYDYVIGSTKNNTLRMTDTQEGIVIEVELPNTSIGRDVYELVSNGYISGASFGCIPLKKNQINEKDRTIEEYTEVLVDEITITPIPAFSSTNIIVDELPEINEEDTKEIDNQLSIAKQKQESMLRLMKLIGDTI